MASEEDSSSSLTCKGTPVSELRVIDIKRELDERGLSKSGSKTQLTERLKAQLLLEKLQQDAAQSSGDELEGKAPNMALQGDKAGQNEFVRLYLQQQQRNIEIQMEVKKQVEEERKRKSADESSADETNLLGDDARPTPAEADLTSPKKFKDEKLDAPVKEGRMPRVARKSSRHASKGENGQEEAVSKDSRPSTPENESIRDRTRSGSSSSDRSPAPEKPRRGRRGRQPRGRASRGARRGGISKKESRSSSPSSSPEEMQPKRKRHSTNSLSSGSRSCSPPQPPDTGTRRSSRRAAVRLTPDQTPEADVEEDKEKGRPQRKRWTRKSSSQETAAKVQNTGIMEESVKAEISKISETSNLLQKDTDDTKEESIDKVTAVRIEEDNDSGQRISPTEKNIAFNKQESEVPKENVPSKSENHDKMDKAPKELELSSYQKDQQQSFLKDVSSTENDEIKKESQTNRIVTPRDISGEIAKSPQATEDLEAKASTSRLVRWKSSRNKSCTPPQTDEAKSKDSESVKITDKRKPPREPKRETKESIVNSLPSLPLKSDDIRKDKVIKSGNTMKNIDEMNYPSETGLGKEAKTEGKSSDEAKGDRQKIDTVIVEDEVVTGDADNRTCKAIGASRMKEDDEAMPQDRLAKRLGALTEQTSGSSSSDSDSNDDSKSSSSSSSRSGSVSSSSKDSHKKAKARLSPENGTSNQKSSEHSPRLSDYPNIIGEKIKSHAMLKGELHPELLFPQRPEHGSPPNKADDGREKVKEAKSSTAAEENKDSPVQREDVDDNLRKEKMSKKRKWGSKTSKATKVMKKPANMEISSDSLKGLIGEVKIAETVFDMETEVVNTLDYDEQEEDRRDIRLKRTVVQSLSQFEEEMEAIGEEEKCETEEDARLVEPRDEALEKKSLSPESIPEEPEKKFIKLTSTVPKEGKRKVKESKKVKMKKVVSPLMYSKEIVKEKIETETAETKEKIIAVRRPSKPVIQQVDDPEPVLEKQTSARNPVSRVLRIVGLVRPFTLNQLKELLKRTGELEEESFWINIIKSECLVTYKIQEEAEITRNALHGTKWPSSNPKILDVDYSTISDVKHRQSGSSGPLPSAQKVREEAAPRQSDRDRKEEDERERRQKAREQREKEREERDKELKDKRETEKQKRSEAARHTNIREWDRDKIQQLSRSRSRSKGRDNERSSRRSRDRERERDDRKRHDRSHDKDEEKKKEKKQKADEEPPAKLLDDLFRKTKSTPCIYWLPLTEEQAQQRLVQKEEREKERQKRLAAIEERNREEQKKREAARLERQRDRQRERSRERLDKERDTGKGREGGMKGKNRGRSLGSRSRSRSRDRRRR